MNIEALSSELCLLAIATGASCGSAMDRSRTNRYALGGRTRAELRRSQSQGSTSRAGHFGIETFLLLLCLTASLLILPLVLPPLPPPPSFLLLVPVGIFVLLIFLAFMKSDVRNITSSCL